MIVVKYFHEEPAGLETLLPDTEPDARSGAEARSLEAFLSAPAYHRGYLAATDTGSGSTGASACIGAWVDALVPVLDRGGWWTSSGDVWSPIAPRSVLESSDPGVVLVTSPSPPDSSPPAVAGDGGVRHALGDIRALLDIGGAVLVAEPAPDGVDWAVFSPDPVSDGLRAAFAVSPGHGVRRFVIPLREARGEHRFYFERYDLMLYAQYEVRPAGPDSD